MIALRHQLGFRQILGSRNFFRDVYHFRYLRNNYNLDLVMSSQLFFASMGIYFNEWAFFGTKMSALSLIMYCLVLQKRDTFQYIIKY